MSKTHPNDKRFYKHINKQKDYQTLEKFKCPNKAEKLISYIKIRGLEWVKINHREKYEELKALALKRLQEIKELLDILS